MPKRKSRLRRVAIKWEWKPGWEYVRERLKEPSSCAPGQYRTMTLSASKDVKGILCCPRGTKLREGGKGCFRGGKKVGKPTMQALRHGIQKFRWNHPDIWASLQAAQPDAQGIRTVRGMVVEKARKIA